MNKQIGQFEEMQIANKINYKKIIIVLCIILFLFWMLIAQGCTTITTEYILEVSNK